MKEERKKEGRSESGEEEFSFQLSGARQARTPLPGSKSSCLWLVE
jgi:hypothetical protein